MGSMVARSDGTYAGPSASIRPTRGQYPFAGRSALENDLLPGIDDRGDRFRARGRHLVGSGHLAWWSKRIGNDKHHLNVAFREGDSRGQGQCSAHRR